MGKWSADQGEQRKHTDVMRGKGEGVRAKRVSGVGVGGGGGEEGGGGGGGREEGGGGGYRRRLGRRGRTERTWRCGW